MANGNYSIFLSLDKSPICNIIQAFVNDCYL